MSEPSAGMELKNRIRSKKIVELLADTEHNYTFTQIAQELGLSRQQLYNLMQKENFSELLVRDFLEQESIHMAHIQELWDSQSPTDRRKAIDIQEKRQARMQNKIMPTLSESRHITTNTAQQKELDKHKEHVHNIETALNSYPPTTKRDFWNRYKQAQQGHSSEDIALSNPNPP